MASVRAPANAAVKRQDTARPNPAQPGQERAGPLHARIAETVAERIRDGVWPVGSDLPPELALCDELGVSRHTMRHALMALCERGLIVRRRGAGTRVIARQRSRRFTQTVNSMDEILHYPKNTYREGVINEMVECSGELQGFLKAPPGSSWFHIGAVRREADSDLPVAWTDIYVLPRYADVVKRRDHASSMVYEQIEKAFGVQIDRAEVDIFPERISAKHAKLLKVAPGSPALVIVRRYYDNDGEPFEMTLTRHPEKRFVYSMELRRSAKI